MEGKTISGYTLKHRLGIGGMAEVWYAENKIGKKAAVKMLLPKLCGDENVTSRFLTEAKIMVELNHPNIRQVYDYGEIDGRPTIVMEYLDGDDLKARMKKGERFSDEDLIMWWNQLVDALNYTHAKGIVHRDIKPGNIFVDNDGNIKLLDFGIAKVKESISSTQTGQKIGTLMYMSPEQVKDSKHIDYHTDIYSLAVTFVHLITGKRPYDSDTSSDFEISEQIVYHPLDLSELPDKWRGFLTPYLEKDLAKRPDLRYFEAVIPVETVEKPLKNIPTEPEPDDEETIVAGAEVKPEKKITEIKKEEKEEQKEEKLKKKSKVGLWIGLGVVAVALLVVIVLIFGSNNKKIVEEQVVEAVEETPVIVLQQGASKISKRNVLSVYIEESTVYINGKKSETSALKDIIKNFITPNPSDENAPMVKSLNVEPIGSFMTNMGVISFRVNEKYNLVTLYIAVGEVCKAYADLREDIAWKKFYKHYEQCDEQQKTAIRKVMPFRVVGIGDYVNYRLDIVDAVVLDFPEIENYFMEKCIKKSDDMFYITDLLTEFNQEYNCSAFAIGVDEYKAEADAKAKKKAEESAKPKHEVQVVTTKTKNNVVYYGYDNPIIVSSNVDGALTVTAKGATVKDLRDNYYMLHVDSDAKEVVVSVSSKGALLGSKKLRLEELPLPEISITNEYNGRISKNAFLAGGRILPMLKHCLIEGVSYAIVSYSVRFKTASGSLKNLYVTGPKYTDELKEAINRAHPGDVFEFYDVKVKANDGREEIRTIKETKSVEIQ